MTACPRSCRTGTSRRNARWASSRTAAGRWTRGRRRSGSSRRRCRPATSSPSPWKLEPPRWPVEEARLPLSPARLAAYAEAALDVARVDVAGVPQADPQEAVRYVVVGTVLYEPVLLALRRLAQQHLYTGDSPSSPPPPPDKA